MDETIFFPSPNWFLPAGLAVSCDEWVIYGGPTKSLCVLEPLPPEYDSVITGQQGYKAHVVNRAHPEKVVCVDLCPEWPERRCFLSGSVDGSVKQWSLEKTETGLKIKSTHSQEMHSMEKEEVIGVGYCKDGYAVTVGSFGHIVKWDLNSNVAKNFNHVMKNFKPVCMACSPHQHMHVAIGTKQGVLFVLDLNGYPRIIYKVRCQDDEILKVSWCPQYEVAIRKCLKESDRRSAATARMEKIRQEPETPETLKLLDERVQNSQTTDRPVKINEKSEVVVDATQSTEALDESGIGKTLPEDSFDESVVQEDDTFDIYKDHEADEFGHKKFQPFDYVVKIPAETVKDDYLADCLKLKEEILKRKAESDSTIGELVEAMDKTELEAKPSTSKDSSVETTDETQLESKPSTSSDPIVKAMDKPSQAEPQEKVSSTKPSPPVEGKITKGEVESSVHIQKHLLATIGKYGSIRVWSKTGKLVGSCVVFSQVGERGKGGRPAGNKRSGCSTLVWARPDSLLIADGNSQLLECNPLKIDCKNKLEWRVVHHLHARGLFALACSAPRVQTPDMAHRPAGAPGAAATGAGCVVWSAAQDRSLARYCLDTGRSQLHQTCGGFIYTVKVCPYDARRVSVSAGDGNVRVWEADTLEEDEARLAAGQTLCYWQNVQGKILVTAWHPERENLLAFSTAESRVGLIDTGTKEKMAKVLQPAISGGIYSLCWGAGGALLAAGNGQLVQYDAFKPDQAAVAIPVSLEGAAWAVSCVQWSPRGVLVGSNSGAVGVLSHQYDMLAAAFVYDKLIHTAEWHPQDTTQGPARYRDLIATCSVAKANTVVILEYTEKEDGGRALSTWRTLAGHADSVLQLAWSPHRDAWLLSTSQDGTVRIWDVSEGVCTSVFGGHVWSAVGAAWAAWPALGDAVLSGGGDCCLRLWRAHQHPADRYTVTKYEVSVDKKNKKGNKREKKQKSVAAGGAGGEDPDHDAEDTQDAIIHGKDQRRRHNKKFLLPMIEKQTASCCAPAPRRLLQLHLHRQRAGAGVGATPHHHDHDHGMDFVHIFGDINDLNRVLDMELERHEDTGAMESWLMLNIVRGNIDSAIQRAAKHDQLDPFLLSVAPCVSFKYWKDATLLYLQQMDRITAKGEENKQQEVRQYGGAIWRRVAALLSLHEVKGAVSALLDAHLHKEAYVLSRTRYSDSLAEQALRAWAAFSLVNCAHDLAAACYIALGDLASAAAALGKSSDEHSLSLAADIAKILGHNTFATHIEDKRLLIQTQKELDQQADKDLTPLPTRGQLAIQKAQNGDDNSEATETDLTTEAESLKVISEKSEIENIPEHAKTELDSRPVKMEGLVDTLGDQTKISESLPKMTDLKDIQDVQKKVSESLPKMTGLKDTDGDHAKISESLELMEDLFTKLFERAKSLPKVENRLKDIPGDHAKILDSQPKIEDLLKDIPGDHTKILDSQLKMEDLLKDIPGDHTKILDSQPKMEDLLKDIPSDHTKILESQPKMEDRLKDIPGDHTKILESQPKMEDRLKDIPGDLAELDSLQEKMQALMKEFIQVTHEGDGDTVKNGGVNGKAEEMKAKVLDRGDELPRETAEGSVTQLE